MTVGRFDLTALIFDLPEQPGVLNRQYRLGRKGLKQIDHFRCETSRPAAIDSQPSHDPILAKQRHRQKRTITQPPKHGPEPCGSILPLIEDVGDLDWLPT